MTQTLKPNDGLDEIDPRRERIFTAGSSIPNTASLGRWLLSWVQSSGAIHGFHNHTVWGDNPYHYQDMTCTHTTFASPLILGLAHALLHRPDPRGQALLERLIDFQAASVADDGQFNHIGFNAGELLHLGLVHNMVPLVAMNGAALILQEGLAPQLRDRIKSVTRRVLETCDRLHPPVDLGATANQDYLRLWARLLSTLAFGESDPPRDVHHDLREMVRRYHVHGLPDPQCAGVLRNSEEKDDLEPAEYYGMMIHPLLLGYRQFDDAALLDEAHALCRHVVRSAWIDGEGATRMHRTYHRIRGQGRWHCLREPMLIGGMGLTLSAMQAFLAECPDAEIEDFLARTGETYAHYQSPSGFFLSATGWGDWRDLVPSSAWQSQDFYHLCARRPVSPEFWNQLFQPYGRVAAVLGQSFLWIESDIQFCVRGYHWTAGADLVGRKDRERFYVDIPGWIGSGKEAPTDCLMTDEPKFLRTEDGVLQTGGRADVDLLLAQGARLAENP